MRNVTVCTGSFWVPIEPLAILQYRVDGDLVRTASSIIKSHRTVYPKSLKLSRCMLLWLVIVGGEGSHVFTRTHTARTSSGRLHPVNYSSGGVGVLDVEP